MHVGKSQRHGEGPKDLVCGLPQIKIQGNHHLQGNVQVYHVRIPVEYFRPVETPLLCQREASSGQSLTNQRASKSNSRSPRGSW